jgi:hypothetical protein
VAVRAAEAGTAAETSSTAKASSASEAGTSAVLILSSELSDAAVE